MSAKLGKDAKLYRYLGGFNWSLIGNVRDLTLSLEKAEADVSSRANEGWRATVGTLKEASIEFEMVWDTSDPNFTAIRNAFLTNSSIELAAADGELFEPDTTAFIAVCMITQFTRSEPLEEAITVSVTAKPTYSPFAPQFIVGEP